MPIKIIHINSLFHAGAMQISASDIAKNSKQVHIRAS